MFINSTVRPSPESVWFSKHFHTLSFQGPLKFIHPSMLVSLTCPLSFSEIGGSHTQTMGNTVFCPWHYSLKTSSVLFKFTVIYIFNPSHSSWFNQCAGKNIDSINYETLNQKLSLYSYYISPLSFFQIFPSAHCSQLHPVFGLLCNKFFGLYSKLHISKPV